MLPLLLVFMLLMLGGVCDAWDRRWPLCNSAVVAIAVAVVVLAVSVVSVAVTGVKLPSGKGGAKSVRWRPSGRESNCLPVSRHSNRRAPGVDDGGDDSSGSDESGERNDGGGGCCPGAAILV